MRLIDSHLDLLKLDFSPTGKGELYIIFTIEKLPITKPTLLSERGSRFHEPSGSQTESAIPALAENQALFQNEI